MRKAGFLVFFFLFSCADIVPPQAPRSASSSSFEMSSSGSASSWSSVSSSDMPTSETSSVSSAADEGLVLWNTLGSLSELQNSVIGLALDPGTACAYVAGRFGGAISNNRAGLRSNQARLPSAVMYLDRFACEFWVKKNFGIVNGMGAIITMNESGQVFHVQHRSGYGGLYRTFVEVEAAGNSLWYSVEHGGISGCNSFLPPGEWIHIAVSVNASEAAGERIRLYRNGIRQGMVVISEAVVPHVLLGGTPYLLMSWAYDNEGFEGCLDNIKFYDYGKTNFSFGSE